MFQMCLKVFSSAKGLKKYAGGGRGSGGLQQVVRPQAGPGQSPDEGAEGNAPRNSA